MRGPKGAPPGICPACTHLTEKWVRGFCHTCYVRKLRAGELQQKHAPLPVALTPLQGEVLEGLLLGDGCLYRHKPTHTPYLTINRAAKDQEYLDWTAEIFRDFLARPVRATSTWDARTGKTYEGLAFTTRRGSVFEEPYNRWYGEGLKRVPVDLTLTPVTLAVWFADDGNVRPTCASWRMQVKLATQGFRSEDTERLRLTLCEFFGQVWTSAPQGSGHNLYTSDEGSRAFLKYIDGALPPGMSRKAYWRQPEARFYESTPEIPARHSHYTPQDKAEALRLRLEEGLSLGAIVKRMGNIKKSALAYWLKSKA